MSSFDIEHALLSYPPRPYIGGFLNIDNGNGNGHTFPLIQPITEREYLQIPHCSDVIELAIQRAQSAFRTWKKTSYKERRTYLQKIADEIRKHRDSFIRLEGIQTGKPFHECSADVDDTITCFEYYASLAEKFESERIRTVQLSDGRFEAAVEYEPIGVVAAITPFNYPLLIASWKLAPALLAGCVVIMKPSEYTPLTTLDLAYVCHEIGLPAGVFSVLLGTGESVGQALVSHPKVNKVAFTGSAQTGRIIMRACAEHFTRVSLELGGKSSAIVLDLGENDELLDTFVEWILLGFLFTNSQICSATSRLLLHRSISNKFLDRLIIAAKSFVPVDTIDQSNKDIKNQYGPLISRKQYERVMSYIEGVKKEGGKIITGGAQPVQMATGYYVEPTIVDATSSMTIFNEEVFGPVLSFVTFDNEDEAIEIANNSEFGLACAVFSANVTRAHQIGLEISCGIQWVNCSQPTFCQLPWSGRKSSGIGCDLGEEGVRAYLEPRQICKYDSVNPYGWYSLPKQSPLSSALSLSSARLSLATLPSSILVRCCSFLSVIDLGKFSSVSHHLHQIVSNQASWESTFLQLRCTETELDVDIDEATLAVPGAMDEFATMCKRFKLVNGMEFTRWHGGEWSDDWFQAMQCFQNLRVLDINTDWQDETEFGRFVRLLKHNQRTLTALTLTRQALLLPDGQCINDEEAGIPIASLPSLRKLTVWGCSTPSVDSLNHISKCAPELEVLQCSSDGIDAGWTGAHSEALSRFSKLLFLEFICPPSRIPLTFDFISSLSTLQSITLTNPVAESVKPLLSLPHLRSLYLRSSNSPTVNTECLEIVSRITQLQELIVDGWIGGADLSTLFQLVHLRLLHIHQWQLGSITDAFVIQLMGINSNSAPLPHLVSLGLGSRRDFGRSLTSNSLSYFVTHRQRLANLQFLCVDLSLRATCGMSTHEELMKIFSGGRLGDTETMQTWRYWSVEKQWLHKHRLASISR